MNPTRLCVSFASSLLLLAILQACGSNIQTAETDPERACLDTAGAIGKAAQRCGGDYQSNYTAFIEAAANGNCKNIKAIRDESGLRNKCFPSLGTVTCTAFETGNLDPSCDQQLEQ